MENNKSRTTYSLINIATGLGGYVFNTIVGFICRVIFVRVLSETYLGINGLFYNILNMLSLAELGVGAAIIYALYKPIATNDTEKIKTLMKYYSTMYRLIGCVVAVAGLSLIPFLRFLVKDEVPNDINIYIVYLMFLFGTVITYFYSYKGSFITANQKNYVVLGLSYIQTTVQSIVQIIILLCFRSFYGYLAAQIIFAFAYNIILSHTANKMYPFLKEKAVTPLPKKEKISLFRNMRALIITRLSEVLVNNTDYIITSIFIGISMVGLSSNYIILSGTLNSLFNQIFNGLRASVGNLNAIESKETQIKSFNFINLANFWLFGFGAMIILFLSNDVVGFLYGNSYKLDTSISVIIAINFYMVGMQNAVWTYKSTMGLFRYGRYLLLLTAAINIFLSVLFIKLGFGMTGILVATAIARLLTNTWYDPYAVFKHGLCLKFSIYVKRYLHYLLILCLSVAICFLGCYFINFEYALLNLFLKGIIVMIVPNLIFFLFFRKTDEFKYLWGVVKRLTAKLFAKLSRRKAKT